MHSSLIRARDAVPNQRPQVLRSVTTSLAVLGLLWIGSLSAYASLAERNSQSSCADYVPASLSASEYVVQTKSRVTVLPLALECSFYAEAPSADPDYVVVEKDLGTAWWLGVPASFLAAASVRAAIFVTRKKRQPSGVDHDRPERSDTQ